MNYLIIFCVLLGISIVITYCVRWFAIRYGIVNNPNPIVPQHTKPVAYLGGVAIAINFIISLVFYVTYDFELFSSKVQYMIILCAPALLFLCLGIIDDILELRPIFKFISQTFIVLFAVFSGNIGLFTNVYWIDACLSAFWLLLLVNAFNFIDVKDGLLAGISMILCILLWFLNPSFNIIFLSMFIAIAAFLLFNKPPASMFLGDAGSHFLGFIGGASLLPITHQLVQYEKYPIICLAVIIPIYELIFITIVRIRKGLPWWKGSPDHLALRLIAAGHSQWKVNIIVWTISGLCSIISLIFINVSVFIQIILICIVCVCVIFFTKYILRWEVNRKP